MSLLEEVRANKTLSRAGREIAAAGRNVWLAGLGTVAQITEVGEGSKKLFGELIEKGRPLAARGRKQVDGLVEKTGATAKEWSRLAQDQAAYEGKKVLRRLQVPTRSDVAALSRRLDALMQQIDELSAHVPAVEISNNDSVAEGETPTPRPRRTAKR